MELLLESYRVSFQDDEKNSFLRWIVVIVTQHCEYTKCHHLIVHLEMINGKFCDIYSILPQ